MTAGNALDKAVVARLLAKLVVLKQRDLSMLVLLRHEMGLRRDFAAAHRQGLVQVDTVARSFAVSPALAEAVATAYERAVEPMVIATFRARAPGIFRAGRLVAERRAAVVAKQGDDDDDRAEVLLALLLLGVPGFFRRLMWGRVDALFRDAVARGLAREELAEELGQLLDDGHLDGYYRGLSIYATTLGRMFGSVAGFKGAGVERYRWLTAGDERVCPRCREMEGLVIPAGVADDFLSRLAGVKTLDELKSAMRWFNDDEEFVAAVRKVRRDPAELAKMGVLLPPIHVACRCSLVLA